MKTKHKVHSLKTLEKEIQRLRGEAKGIENQLEKNFDHLQENFSSMFVSSVFRKKQSKEEEEKSNFFDAAFKNEKFNAAINKITGHIADRASEGIDSLIDKIFHRKKSNS